MVIVLISVNMSLKLQVFSSISIIKQKHARPVVWIIAQSAQILLIVLNANLDSLYQIKLLKVFILHPVLSAHQTATCVMLLRMAQELYVRNVILDMNSMQKEFVIL